MTDYMRQLSIVILGIIVTFAGSNAIADYMESREIESALQLVKNELELNRKAVKRISDRIRLEQEACGYVLKYRNCLEKASEDTLKMLEDIPFQTRGLVYTKDAFELLKTSALFQKIKSKALVLQILTIYNSLETTEISVKIFYDLKSDYIAQLMNNEKFDFYDLELHNAVREYWKSFLSTREGWNLCNFVVHNFGSSHPFHETEAGLEKTVRMLEREYGF